MDTGRWTATASTEPKGARDAEEASATKHILLPLLLFSSFSFSPWLLSLSLSPFLSSYLRQFILAHSCHHTIYVCSSHWLIIAHLFDDGARGDALISFRHTSSISFCPSYLLVHVHACPPIHSFTHSSDVYFALCFRCGDRFTAVSTAT